MSTRFTTLAELADLDGELITLERSRGSLPARVELGALAEQFAEIERARQLLEPERAPLASAVAAIEEEVASLSNRKAQVETRLAQATGGGKELEAMHTEARHLDEKMRGLEDQELELMERLEPLEERLGSLRAEGAPLLARRDELAIELKIQEAELDLVLVERRAARTELASRCDEALLARYEKIASKANGIGAARLEHGTCSGCHLALAAAELDHLRHLDVDDVSVCDQCDRILLRSDQLSE